MSALFATTTRCAAATRAVARSLVAHLRADDVVILAGTLGAGKTAFVKGAADALGVCDEVTSPTFAIVHEYSGRVPVAHIDAYRVPDVDGLVATGVEELFETHITFVEWGDPIVSLFPDGFVRVAIREGDGCDETREPDEVRHIEISIHGTRFAGRAAVIVEDLEALSIAGAFAC